MRSFFLVLITSILLASCNEGQHGDIKANTEQPGGNKYTFQLNPSEGVNYYYTVSNSIQTELSINNKEMETSNETEIGLACRFSKDSSGNYLLNMTYDKIHIVIKKKGDEDRELDAGNGTAAFDPVERILANIKGKSLQLTLDRKGNVLKVSGNDQLSASVMESIRNEDLQFKQMVQGVINKLTGTDFISNNLGQCFKLLPDSAVVEGSRWNRKSLATTDISYEANMEYTVTSISSDLIKLETSGKIGSEKPTLSEVMGQKVTSQLSGDQEGEFKVDRRSGMLLRGETTAKIKGSLQLQNRELPVKIRVKNQVSQKKI